MKFDLIRIAAFSLVALLLFAGFSVLKNNQKGAEPSKATTDKTKMESQTLDEAKKATDKATNKNPIVSMQTEKGEVQIELFMEDAPITAGNFKDLVERGFYNGLIFHRIIKGFVVQGGCPKGNGTGNFVDPETSTARFIKHEWSTKHSHDKAGIVAMARTSDPNSASSQFFIDLAPLPSLNPGGVDPYGYAIFGQVIKGMEVVNQIVADNLAPHPGSDGVANPVKIIKAKML